MNKLNKVLLVVLIICSSTNAFSRSTIELTENEKFDIQLRIEDKIEQFQGYLRDIGNKKKPDIVRDGSLKSCVKLFIGDCEPYSVKNNETGRVLKKNAVKMETSSLRNGREYRDGISVKNYLYRLKNNRSYSNIKIEQADAVRVDNLRKVGDGKYEAVAYFCQYFRGYRGDGNYVAYSDYTEKAVRIYVDIEEVEQHGRTDTVIKIKLGDIKVIVTERIK